MVDQVFLSLLVFVISLAPPDQKEVRVDLGDLSGGSVQSLVATRTEEGWTVRAAAGGDETMVFQRTGDGVFKVTMGHDELEIDIRPLTGSMAPLEKSPTQSLAFGGEKVVVSRTADGVYIFNPEDRKFLVARVDAAATRLHGLLTHKEIEPTMSVEAYLGNEFILEQDGGATTVLRPSASVTRETLLALAGKRVEVGGGMVEGKAPSPEEAAPMENGKPMLRGAGFEVRSINVLPAEGK